jgi:hypothetical protein
MVSQRNMGLMVAATDGVLPGLIRIYFSFRFTSRPSSWNRWRNACWQAGPASRRRKRRYPIHRTVFLRLKGARGNQALTTMSVR